MIQVKMTHTKLDGPQRELTMVASRLTDFGPALMAASEVIYTATRERFDARGAGMWPPLAESTVAGNMRMGDADPDRPLARSVVAKDERFDDGGGPMALMDSATTPGGPYSYLVLEPTFIVIGVDWARDGWQIPVVLSEGTRDAGVGHHTVIPARPIWPSAPSVMNAVSKVIRDWVRLGRVG